MGLFRTATQHRSSCVCSSQTLAGAQDSGLLTKYALSIHPLGQEGAGVRIEAEGQPPTRTAPKG
jgi:hypothetical protein